MSESETPERPAGMVISPDEYDLISRPLVAMAEEARKHGQTDAYTAIKRFVVRMKQAVFAGEGVPDDTMERLTNAVEEALCSNELDRARVSISAMLAAVVRMDPNPGHTIAMHLAPTFVRFVTSVAAASQAAIAAETLKKFYERLKKEHAAFEQAGWPEKPSESLEYAATLAAFCAEELERGADPFSADTEAANDAPEPEEPN